MGEEETRKCKTVLFYLDEENAAIVRTLLFSSKENREGLMEFFMPGRITRISMEPFMYILAYIAKHYSQDNIEVSLCCDDENAEHPKFSLKVDIYEQKEV